MPVVQLISLFYAMQQSRETYQCANYFLPMKPMLTKKTNTGERHCGVSAFLSAQKHEHTDVWKGLTYYGDIEATDCVNNTALHRAVDKGDKYAVNILLHCGANPNAKDRFGRTPLHAAAAKGSDRDVEILVRKANLDLKDRKGKTPLHLVVEGEFGSVVRSLIESGADCHSKDILRRTPLKQASAAGDTMLAAVLSDRNWGTTSGLL
ncbi:hypothetical protein APSETT444_010699 [Aspergillus pseudonomiae]